jgi:UV DNA damage repair endonuclease
MSGCIANITDTEVDAQELEATVMQMTYHAGILDVMEEAQDHCWRVLVRGLAP